MSADLELIPSDGLMPAVRTEEEFEACASTTSYLARVALMTSSSDKCKEGLFPVNHYAYIDSAHVELGKEVDILVIEYHPKALDVSTPGTVVASYDVNSDLYQDIVARSDVKDSKCMFGPEFLIYVPVLKKFATFFLSSKSARRECARSMNAQLRKAATLKSKLIKTASRSWQCPVVTPCSTAFELPSIEEINAKITMFRESEKAPTPELAPETDDRAR